MSKGSKRRPQYVSDIQLAENWEKAFIITTSEVNTKIYICDDFLINAHRKKLFTWFQRKMIKLFFGWRIENE